MNIKNQKYQSEWEGRTGIYFAQGMHDVRRNFRMATRWGPYDWPRVKYLPVWPNLTQSINFHRFSTDVFELVRTNSITWFISGSIQSVRRPRAIGRDKYEWIHEYLQFVSQLRGLGTREIKHQVIFSRERQNGSRAVNLARLSFACCRFSRQEECFRVWRNHENVSTCWQFMLTFSIFLLVKLMEKVCLASLFYVTCL